MSVDPLQIIPVNFGVKFQPPKLGLEYHLPGQPQVQHIYEISLNSYLSSNLTADQVVSQIFVDHMYYIHPRVIGKQQLKRLIERVFAKLTRPTSKENQTINKAEPILV
jgi:hypothetical protein